MSGFVLTVVPTSSGLSPGWFYFEGSHRKHSWLLQVAKLAAFSSQNRSEDGGATSRGALGEWESSPQYAENYQDPQGWSIDENCIYHTG